MPWFVNWNDYKTTFEVEAEKILGHPVRVVGSASATILPSPSLTFTEVQVGDLEGQPMMTVDRFAVTIELMPLLQGEFRVVSMKLERPQVRIVIDDRGAADWLKRSEASQALDPRKVILEDVEISDGSIIYDDPHSSIAIRFEQINAVVEARTLSGPWRVEGTYLDNGEQVPFHFATGLLLEDGTMRVKSDFSPARRAIGVAADGIVSRSPETGLVYRGTYNATEVGTVASEATDAASGEFAGWRSEGSFTLTRDRLVVDKALLSHGPPDRPTSVAGALSVTFGDKPWFEASAEARQLDLDRTLGGGPTQPVEVSAAAERLVEWLTALPVPPIPGRVEFDVPGIVVGGSVIQDVSFTAQPASTGWRIERFHARLPGQATLDAMDGLLTTTATRFGFAGNARLAVAQPATFAAWWRGRAQQDAGRLLAAFDIAGKTRIAPGRVAVDLVEARIGDARITGSFDWGESTVGLGRELGMDLAADRIDFSQVKALAELLVGRNLNDTAGLADSYSIRLAAGAFAFDDIRMSDVAVDAQYADDMLTVVQLAIGDLGGAGFRVTSGRIDDLTTHAFGHLNATLDATTLGGVASIVDRFAPDSGLARWLGAASAALAPAVVKAKVTAPAEPGGTGFRIELDGVAGSTSFDITADSSGTLANWRSAAARLDIVLDSPDTAGLARQVGFSALASDADTGAHVEVRGRGVPGDGLDTTVVSELAGLTANASGKLRFSADFAPSFAGRVGVTSDDLDLVIAMAGLGIPGAAIGTAVDLDGSIAISAKGADLDWQSGTIGGQFVGGKVSVARDADRAWRIGGSLQVDEADLGWIMALGLGFAPMPTGEAAVPWSKTPFISPVYGPVTGKLAVTADHLTVGDGLDVANTRLDLALQPQRLDLDLTAGQIAGGTVTGGFSIHNVAGNANFIGRFNLKGGALESFVWQIDGRSVATGVIDLSANFEATGRSPAGLASSATGGGVIAIRDGQVRYVNPNAARLVVRASDLGQQYTEDGLRLSFTEVIDGDTLAFEQADSAFAIAAGAARIKNLTLRTRGLEASVNAVIDLNSMTMDSDWTLTFDPGDTKVEGTDPRVGIVFRGPIAQPSRSIDVLQLASYLNMRQEVRMLEIIAMEEATRAEKDRLTRLVAKLREDGARRAREAREAAEAEALRRAAAIAANAAVERLQELREMVAEQRRVKALRLYAEKVAAERTAAEGVAAERGRVAAAERDRAEGARAAFARAVAAERQAVTGASAAAAALAEARSVAEAADQAASAAVATAEAADAAAAVAGAAASQANERAATAAADKAAADAALAAVVADAGDAGVAADQAEGRVAETGRADNAARGVVAEANAAMAVADTALAEAEALLDAALADADEKNAAEALAADAARAAAAGKGEADATVATASEEVAAGTEARDAAGKRADAANTAAVAAQTQADDASATAKAAAGVAVALLADEDPGDEALAAARDMQTIARVAADRAKARQAAADEAARRAAVARASRNLAEALLGEAQEKLANATAAADEAARASAQAGDAAELAAAANAAALQAVTTATEARDTAATEARVRHAAADTAAAALVEAEEASRAAAELAIAARAAAGGVLNERATAEARAADVAGVAEATATAAEQAAGELAQALADQTTARTSADRAVAAAGAAATVLVEATRADEVARGAVAAMTLAREEAERAVAEAEVAAAAAIEAAEAASKEAAAKAAAAEAAERAAQRAADGAGPFDTGAVEAMPDRNQAARLSPIEATGSASPGASVAVPMPRRPPRSLVSDNRPVVIVPRQ